MCNTEQSSLLICYLDEISLAADAIRFKPDNERQDLINAIKGRCNDAKRLVDEMDPETAA